MTSSWRNCKATGRRLKEMEKDLDVELPRLRHYLSLDNAVWQTSAPQISAGVRALARLASE